MSRRAHPAFCCLVLSFSVAWAMPAQAQQGSQTGWAVTIDGTATKVSLSYSTKGGKEQVVAQTINKITGKPLNKVNLVLASQGTVAFGTVKHFWLDPGKQGGSYKTDGFKVNVAPTGATLITWGQVGVVTYVPSAAAIAAHFRPQFIQLAWARQRTENATQQLPWQTTDWHIDTSRLADVNPDHTPNPSPLKDLQKPINPSDPNAGQVMFDAPGLQEPTAQLDPGVNQRGEFEFTTWVWGVAGQASYVLGRIYWSFTSRQYQNSAGAPLFADISANQSEWKDYNGAGETHYAAHYSPLLQGDTHWQDPQTHVWIYLASQ